MSARSSPTIGTLSLLLSDRDIAVLEDLERFRLLDTRLIQRLHFPAGVSGPHVTASSATRTTVRVLSRLEDHGCISRLGRRIGGTGHGSSQTVWQLAATGERLLRARRGQNGRRRYLDPGTLFLSHTLDVARYAADLHELTRASGSELLELKTEPSSWRTFQSGLGGALTLKPDLVVITADTERETHTFIEIDRDSEHLPTILRKCLLYQQYRDSGDYQARNDGVFPAIIWVTPTHQRAERILTAIHADQSLNSSLFRAGTSTTTLPWTAP